MRARATSASRGGAGRERTSAGSDLLLALLLDLLLVHLQRLLVAVLLPDVVGDADERGRRSPARLAMPRTIARPAAAPSSPGSMPTERAELGELRDQRGGTMTPTTATFGCLARLDERVGAEDALDAGDGLSFLKSGLSASGVMLEADLATLTTTPATHAGEGDRRDRACRPRLATLEHARRRSWPLHDVGRVGDRERSMSCIGVLAAGRPCAARSRRARRARRAGRRRR